MANQYDTIKKIRELIQRENYIADISWSTTWGGFRLVCRWRDGADYVTYIYYGDMIYGGWYSRTEYKRALCWATYKGWADYNKYPAFIESDKYYTGDHDFRSTYKPVHLMTQMLATYARRYTRPATPKCIYTIEELEAFNK